MTSTPPAKWPISGAGSWGSLVVATVLALLSIGNVSAQLVVQNSTYEPYDPQRLIKDVFLGEGVQITNIVYDGPREAVGYFEKARNAIGIDKGILLTTGLAATMSGGRTGADALGQFSAQFDNMSAVRDPNLEVIEPFQLLDGSQNMFNVSRFTITFVPTGDHVSFRYVFASDEYPNFVCSEYNDVFGFFISGPGFAGPYANNGVNIATLPASGLPVTINNVNGGLVGSDGDISNCSGANGSLSNTAYYRDNTTPGSFPVYNGMTTVLTAEANVVPCSTYTITIVVGDVRDAAYDSGVFLEAKSFSTPTLAVDVETISLAGDIAEGCTAANLVFRLNQPLSVPRTVTYTVGGTATAGADYNTLPGVAVIPAGTTELIIPITAVDDGIVEGQETIVIDVQADICSTKRVSVGIVDRLIPPVPILVDTTVCAGAPLQLNATLPTAVDTAKTFRNTNSIDFSAFGVPYVSTIAVAGVTPTELRNGLVFKVCVDLVHGNMSDIDMFLFGPNGNYLELSTDNGGTRSGSMSQFCFSPKAVDSIVNPLLGPHYTGLFQPEGRWSELWNDPTNPANGTWRLQITDDANGGFGTLLGWSIVFEPLYDVRYSWTPTAGLSCSDCPRPVANPSTSTDYIVTATDSYGCTETAIGRVKVFTPPVVPVVSCSASFDHLVFSWPADTNVLRFEVSEDNVNYTSIGTVNTHTLSGLGFGVTRTLHVRAVGACSNSVSSSTCTTQSCPNFTPAATATAAACARSADGAVLVLPNGGAAPYVFTLGSRTNATGNFGGLIAGNYTVAVRDVNGCTGSVSFTITAPADATTSVNLSAPMACGAPYQATAAAAGGAGAPYSYSWSHGQNTATATFATPGLYYVDIADAAGCSFRDSVLVPTPTPLTASYSLSAISCAGATDGAATATGQGGRSPYTYRLTDSSGATVAATGLAPGSYRFVVEDAIGCSVDTNFTLLAPPAITLSFTSTDVACNGAADGVLSVSVAGARGPVTYQWPGFSSTTNNLTGLSAGSYQVIVRDSVGCTAQASGTVAQPSTLSISVAVDSVGCFGESSGEIRVSRTGGVAPFTFDLGRGSPGQDSVLRNVAVGSYRIVVTDAMGCSQTRNVEVGEPFVLQAFHQQQPIRCAGEATGLIDLSVSGGRRPYSFVWSNGATTEDIGNLSAGSYTVAITDASGCQLSYEATLIDPPPLRLVSSQTNVSCHGKRDASISLAPVGGRQPYVYEWTGPNGYAFFGTNATLLDTGLYVLAFRDAAGCRIDTTFAVTQPNVLQLVTAVADSICYGTATGVASVNVFGGTAPYSYSWASGSTQDSAKALRVGSETIVVTDAQGCTAQAVAVVPELAPLSLKLAQTAVRCYRDSNGVAELVEASYGNRVTSLSNFTVSWRGYADSLRTQLTGLGGGEEAHITVTDVRGCRAVDSIDIAEPAPIDVLVTVDQHVSCRDGADGKATALPSGGTSAFTYSWSTSGESVATARALAAGVHIVTAIDANGCQDTASIIIHQPDSLLLQAVLTQVNCFAENTGSISMSATGGNVPYGYRWSHGPTSAALDSLIRGDYTVSVTDSKGCQTDTTLTVTRATEVLATASAIGVTCAGDTDGSVLLEASGGNGPYTYRLGDSPYLRFPNFRFVAPGIYVFQVRDRDGCPSEIANIIVDEPQPLIVEAGDLVDLELGDSVLLSSQTFNAVGQVSYRWLPNDSTLFSCATCAETYVYPLVQGNLAVYAVDERGCEAEDRLLVKLRKRVLVRVPTAFSPNDDGRDDKLLIHGRTRTRIERFQVFNRWGELIYEGGDFWANDTQLGWDGAARGKAAPPGLYLWRAEVSYLGGTNEVYTGETVLIR